MWKLLEHTSFLRSRPLHISSMGPRVFYISASTPPQKGLVFPVLTLAQFTVIICLDDVRIETGKGPAAQCSWLPLAIRVQDPHMLHQGGKWPAGGLPVYFNRQCKRDWRVCGEDQGHPLMSLGSLLPRKGLFILLVNHSKGHRRLSLTLGAIDNFIFVFL